MKLKLDENWTTVNNGYPLLDEEVKRYLSVLPTKAQAEKADRPFYCFIHFGMNTATGREWGNATEKLPDFDILKIKPDKWVKAIKASGAGGIILTCKHHDGFCLWNTGTTDFNVMNTELKLDVVKAVKDACDAEGLEFGVYLSPWDMHEPSYGTPMYNDIYCRQLTELLTNYGRIFEVWLDGARGAGAKDFSYDWTRYYRLIRTLQPDAAIAICGPDVRWVGNEAGKSRKSEYCVVPEYLTVAETVQQHSRQTPDRAAALQQITSSDEDLGSRELLSKNKYLTWYPAEVDVSIRKGWFHPGGGRVKGANKLFKIYLNSVGNNSFLLLNVPPSRKGVIPARERRILKKLGNKIGALYANPVISQSFGELKNTDGYIEFKFNSAKKLRCCVIREDITRGQRIEKFDFYILKPNGKYKRIYAGTVVGMRKIIKLKGSAVGALLIIRQSRGNPVLSEISLYE